MRKFLVYDTVLLAIGTELTHLAWNSVPFDQHLPISPSPQTLESTILLFAAMSLTTLYSIDKWDNSICIIQIF